jgi:hypothetical protein
MYGDLRRDSKFFFIFFFFHVTSRRSSEQSLPCRELGRRLEYVVEQLRVTQRVKGQVQERKNAKCIIAERRHVVIVHLDF